MSGFSGSHCNGASESGWTMYFEESFETEAYGGEREVEEEEGDLSMISDASSRPRNVYYEENCLSVRRSGGKSGAAESKRKEEMGRRNQYSCLDDTASSPVFGLCKRETNPHRKEGFQENVKEESQSRSRKQHGKKQESFFGSSSPTKFAKNVTGEFREEKWEQRE